MTVQDDPNYWTEGNYDDWLSEMAGGRLILERFANITDGSIIGRNLGLFNKLQIKSTSTTVYVPASE
jgi:hypothetical protein